MLSSPPRRSPSARRWCPGQLSDLLQTRGLYLTTAGRRAESIAYFREAARLSEQAGDTAGLGRVLVTCRRLGLTPPPGRSRHARPSCVRQTGVRDFLAVAITNEVGALHLGDWDRAESILGQAGTPMGWPTSSSSTATGAGWPRCAGTRPPPRPSGGPGRPAGQRRSAGPVAVSVVTAFAADARVSSGLRCGTPGPPSSRRPSGINHDCARWAGRWPPVSRTRRRTAAHP